MSSQKLTLSKELVFPVKCKCVKCGNVNDGNIVFSVTGEAIVNQGSPFGRKERAQQNAENNLRQNMKYHILKLYEESENSPDKFIRYMKEKACSECGKAFPWCEIQGATREDSNKTVKAGLFPALFSLSSKKFKSTSKDVKAAIDNIPKEFIPTPALPQDELVKQYGLSDVSGNEPADVTALFMHS